MPAWFQERHTARILHQPVACKLSARTTGQTDNRATWIKEVTKVHGRHCDIRQRQESTPQRNRSDSAITWTEIQTYAETQLASM